MILSSQVVRVNSYLGNSKSRAPLFLKNIQANAAIAVDVRMENFCPESHLKNTLNRYQKIRKIHEEEKTEIPIPDR